MINCFQEAEYPLFLLDNHLAGGYALGKSIEMKKESFFLAACALLASVFSAEAAPVPLPAMPPAGVIPPPTGEVEMPTMPRMRYEMGANFGYGFSAAPGSRYATDMVGIELEAARYITEHQALTLTLGLAGASLDSHFLVYDSEDGMGAYPFEDDYTRSDFYLMGGYRAVIVVCHRVAVSFGVKGGLDVQALNTEYGCHVYRHHPYWYDDYNDKTDIKAGFGYAGYAHISVEVMPQTFIEVGYQYRGSTTQPRARFADWGGGFLSRAEGGGFALA